MDNNTPLTSPSINNAPVTPDSNPVVPSVPPQKNHTRLVLILLLLFVGFIILLSSSLFFLNGKTNSQVTSTSAPTGTPTRMVSSAPTAVELLTYEGNIYSYQYPTNWINGEEGQGFFNLMSPDFTLSPLTGSAIIIEIEDDIGQEDTLEDLINKLEKGNVPYEQVTVDNNPTIQYEEIIVTGNEEEGYTEEEHKVITLLYKANKRIELIYMYPKGHKNDAWEIYNKFLTTFQLH